MEETLLGIWPL